MSNHGGRQLDRTVSTAAAQEEPEAPPERASTILVNPDNQGVVAVTDRTRVILVNLSRSRDTALRYFWIYNADDVVDLVALGVACQRQHLLWLGSKWLGDGARFADFLEVSEVLVAFIAAISVSDVFQHRLGHFGS